MTSKVLKFISSSEQPVVIYEDETDDETEHYHRTYENNQEILRKCGSGSKCMLQKIKEEGDELKLSSCTFLKKRRPFGDSLNAKIDELELKMSVLSVEESLAWDKFVVIQNEIDKIETVLEAFLQYMDAIDLENKARSRMCNQLRCVFEIENFAKLNEDMHDMIRKVAHYERKNKNKDNDIKQRIITILDSRLGLNDYYQEYENRKHDYRLACGNFKKLLSSAKLTEKQLQKFTSQYDKISNNFTHSRYDLLNKIPEGLKLGVQTFLDAIKEIGKIIDKSYGGTKDFQKLFTMMSNLEVITDSSNAA